MHPFIRGTDLKGTNSQLLREFTHDNTDENNQGQTSNHLTNLFACMNYIDVFLIVCYDISISYIECCFNTYTELITR